MRPPRPIVLSRITPPPFPSQQSGAEPTTYNQGGVPRRPSTTVRCWRAAPGTPISGAMRHGSPCRRTPRPYPLPTFRPTTLYVRFSVRRTMASQEACADDLYAHRQSVAVWHMRRSHLFFLSSARIASWFQHLTFIPNEAIQLFTGGLEAKVPLESVAVTSTVSSAQCHQTEIDDTLHFDGPRPTLSRLVAMSAQVGRGWPRVGRGAIKMW
ncbi:hypothetical protein C8R44DRAFT_745625 [Mycena epipterygia]|nr:hypothetical protein C8R44DRAFT_745625 [Mycena epipterygia]